MTVDEMEIMCNYLVASPRLPVLYQSLAYIEALLQKKHTQGDKKLEKRRKIVFSDF